MKLILSLSTFQNLLKVSKNCEIVRNALIRSCWRMTDATSPSIPTKSVKEDDNIMETETEVPLTVLTEAEVLPLGPAEVTEPLGPTEVREGKAVVICDPKHNIFYNPTQEVNRDISIVAIQAHINREQKKDVKIIEAMAASGIRSIRYGLELQNVGKVLANDFSKDAIASIHCNSKLNGTENIVEPSFKDACTMMRDEQHKGFVIDLDPYGSPAPFIETAVQSVQEGGMLLITATDMAILAGGNAAESCYAKYGSMPLKSKACHEIALRIIIHAVQTSANRYGRVAIPLISLKIDFYIRLIFKVVKSAEKAKESSLKTSIVYQCTGCRSLSFQPMAIKKSEKHYGFAHGPPVSEKCSNCSSVHHIGGPLWSGPIHDKDFVAEMAETLKDSFFYLNTFDRIQGILNLVGEEVEVPLLYDIGELCSVLKMQTIPLLMLRSAIMNLGYQISLSHVGPNTLKTNIPNHILWDILRSWRLRSKCSDLNLKEGTPGYNIMQKEVKTTEISFDVHPDAHPVPKDQKYLRYQMNPTRNWGPGVRNVVRGQKIAEDKRTANQGKIKRKKSLRILNDRQKIADNDRSNSNGETSDASPETKCFKSDAIAP